MENLVGYNSLDEIMNYFTQTIISTGLIVSAFFLIPRFLKFVRMYFLAQHGVPPKLYSY